ncbi:MAG: hypothetical protein JO116_26015 [Planctomycetaceae bacterium]|nr:hypothetical protein [Planctomycetaceae bacterium]
MPRWASGPCSSGDRQRRSDPSRSGRRARGVLTEDGPRPGGADRHSARELPTGESAARTVAHARDGDAMPWCGAVSTPGSRATIEAGHQVGRSCRRVEQGFTRPAHGAAGSGAHQIRILHVAGHRGSKPPGIGARGERSLADVFRR